MFERREASIFSVIFMPKRLKRATEGAEVRILFISNDFNRLSGVILTGSEIGDGLAVGS